MRSLRCLLVWVVLFVLVTPCMGVGPANTVIVFKGNETTVPFENQDGTVAIRKPLAFRIPAFVGGVIDSEELFVLLCDARYNGWSDWDFIEVAGKTSYGNYTIWEPAQIAVKNTRKSSKSVAGDATAVMKGSKVYVLVPSWDDSPYSWVNHKSNSGWNPLMLIGNVRMKSDNAEYYVVWDPPLSLKALLPKMAGSSPGFQFIGGVGTGVVMANGTIVFPLQVANTAQEVMSSIMYSTDDGATWIMGEMTKIGTSECSVMEWGQGKLVLSTRFDGGPRKVYETNDMGATWEEFLPFSNVWGNQPNRLGPGCQASIISVSLQGKTIMLSAHPLNTEGSYSRDHLQLWMSDGNRIFHVGMITEPGKGTHSGYSIIAYLNNRLYCLHEINPFGGGKSDDPFDGPWDRVLAISDLSPMMDKVHAEVKKWNDRDAALRMKGIPTNGLAGYLSISGSITSWSDVYSGVNARVTNAVPVSGGFRFLGTAAGGAQWPVSEQGQNQRYYFTRTQFTIVATVSIDAITAVDGNAVLGASMDASGAKSLIGLGFTNDRQWHAFYTGGAHPIKGTSFELGKQYNVAIIFVNGKGSVYVDAVPIMKGQDLGTSGPSITHFYMGGYGNDAEGKDCQSTVINVMLYNRALNIEEVAALAFVKVGIDFIGSANGTVSECDTGGEDDICIISNTIRNSEDKKTDTHGRGRMGDECASVFSLYLSCVLLVVYLIMYYKNRYRLELQK